MGDDAIGGRALGGMDRAHPPMADVAIGKPAEVERLLGAIGLLNDDAAAVGVDGADGGDIAVVAPGAAVVARELHLVADAQFDRHFIERLGLIAAPAGGLPRDLAALGADQRHRAGIGVDGIHRVADTLAQPLFPAAAPERDPLAGSVAGGVGGFGAGEVAGLEDGGAHGVAAERAIVHQRSPDRIGEPMSAFAGRIEHQRRGARLRLRISH